MDVSFWCLQLLNATMLSMLLFLLSVGLTIIFGLLHFVNLAHSALYMLGAYISTSIVASTGSFWITLVIVPLCVAGIGILLYFTLIGRMRDSNPMSQVLVTFGLIFVFLDLVRIAWGDVAIGFDVPPTLFGTVDLFGVSYPAYRLFVILLGMAVMLSLQLALSRTGIGATIRASVENESMAAALGINVRMLFLVVFSIGCALAGLAGAVVTPIFSATTGMGMSILIPTLIVVVIGGLGSLHGAIVGSFIIGFIETFSAVLLPDFAAVITYIMLALVLVLRPQGLLPARS